MPKDANEIRVAYEGSCRQRVNYKDITHDLTGYRFGHMGK